MTSYRNEPDDVFMDFVSKNRNLQFTDGNGLNSKFIDVDSKIKNDVEQTHDKKKRQVIVRNFLAAPNLGKGESVPTLEHVLQSGEDTSVCGGVRETMYKKTPLNYSTQYMFNGNNQALDRWNHQLIGQSSKEILKAIRQK